MLYAFGYDFRVIVELKECAQTARKAVVQVQELFANGLSPQSMNQIQRWIATKEEHMSKIITIVAEYCLCVHSFASPFRCHFQVPARQAPGLCE